MDRRRPRPGEEARVPIERAVGLRFKHPGEFVEEQAANVSSGGLFIRTRRPHPVGSVFEFELRLEGEGPPISGKAQVAWVRRRSERLDEPVGMGVRFVELADEGRRQIVELVAAHPAAGGRSADAQAPDGPRKEESAALDDTKALVAPAPDRRPAAAVPAVAATPVAAPAVSPGKAATAAPLLPAGRAAAVPPRRSRLPWILLIVVVVAALAGALWPRPAARTPSSAAAAPPEPPAAIPAAAPTAGVEEATRKPQPARRVEEWARAWSAQRVDDYLAAYSARFVPDGGLSRSAWERQRRARLLAPRWIEVGLAFVEIEETGPDRVRVRFVQKYESDSYSDVVRKLLELGREADGWKILRESVEP